jgi:hypothetical protein
MDIFTNIIDGIKSNRQFCFQEVIIIKLTLLISLGLDSKTDEWDNEYDQRLHSSLTGLIRELVPTDDSNDADTRFQPPLDSSNQEHAASEGYRLENYPNIAPSISLAVSQEKILARHKRQGAASGLATLPTSPMDGSGVTEEGSKFFSEILFLCSKKRN